jgi:tRNA(adenine34) deaminase
MGRAMERAREAWVLGEVPVGAVIVLNGQLVAEGGNRTLGWNDPTAHAEVVALRAAARQAGAARLPDVTLYVTLEPCAQCAGAAVLSRVARLVYGASDPKTGMAGSLGNLVQDPRLNHRMPVTPGVLAHEAGELLRAFFRERRR